MSIIRKSDIFIKLRRNRILNIYKFTKDSQIEIPTHGEIDNFIADVWYAEGIAVEREVVVAVAIVWIVYVAEAIGGADTIGRNQHPCE